MRLQQTLKRAVVIDGVGLHAGKPVRLTVRPGNPGQGIVFVRTDLKDRPMIPATFQNVVNTQLATTIGDGKVSIGTVEHLLAALQGLSIDNAIIEVDGPEVPILDGSAGIFFDAFEKAGVENQLPLLPHVFVKRRVELMSNEKWAVVEPSNRLEIHGSIDWDHPVIGYQEYRYTEGKESFRELMRARTFGFLKDVEMLRKAGLARGGSLENAVVLNETGVVNPDGLRYSDEFIRHKVLDALGDFKLAGLPIVGAFRLHRAGHDLHAQLLKEIFSDSQNYEIRGGRDVPDVSEGRDQFAEGVLPAFVAARLAMT